MSSPRWGWNPFLANLDRLGDGGAPPVPTPDYHTARYIVGAGGESDGANYTTIASAYAAALAAGAPQTVFIQPGTYVENLTLSPRINLAAFGCDGLTSFDDTITSPNVIIQGTVTASYNGSCVCTGIQFETNGAAAINVSGASASTLILNACSIFADDFTGLVTNSNTFVVQFYNSSFYVSGTNHLFEIVNTPVAWTNCQFLHASSATASTVSGGNISFLGCTMTGLFITTSGVGSVRANSCMWSRGGQTLLTTVGTGNSVINNCDLASTTATTISIGTGTSVSIHNTNISSSNAAAISGAGTLNYGSIIFNSTSSGISVTTQVPRVASNDALKILAPGAYPYTVLAQDSYIPVDTSAARTILLPSAPATGQNHEIKDNVGTAHLFNITVDGNGKNIDDDTTDTIETPLGSRKYTYNGTKWDRS